MGFRLRPQGIWRQGHPTRGADLPSQFPAHVRVRAPDHVSERHQALTPFGACISPDLGPVAGPGGGQTQREPRLHH